MNSQITDYSTKIKLSTLPFKMKFFIAALALAATAIAGGSGTTCSSGQSVVCKDNGNGGLLSLGNIATGALGDSCSGGDVYCCSDKDIDEVRLYPTLSLNITVTKHHFSYIDRSRQP
jgi:hypothetical protein